MRKICIIGTTPSRWLTPFDDKTWEIWTIGPGGRDIPGHRWDRLFEIHGAGRNHTWPEDYAEYLDFISKTEPPQQIVTIRPIGEMLADWANSHQYTEDRVKELITGDWRSAVLLDRQKLLDKYERMWMSSSFSWAMAQALEEDVTELGVYGVDLETGEEYVSQFAGARHFISIAKLRGVKIHIPAFSGLLRDPNPYPDRWETYEALWFQNRITMLTNIASQKQAELDDIRANIHRREGAARTLDDIVKNYDGKVRDEAQNASEALKKENEKAAVHLQKCAADLSHINGQLGMAKLYMEQFVYTGMTGIQL